MPWACPDATIPPMTTQPSQNRWHDQAMAVSYLDGLTDPVVVLDQNATIREANDAFFALARGTRESLLNESLPALLRQAPTLAAFVSKAANMATSVEAQRHLLECDNGAGEIRTLVLTGIPIRNMVHENLLAIRIEDVTAIVRERGEIEAERLAVHASARALERLNEELVGFSYSVAHDLRAPLRFIDKFAYLLMERHGSELPAEALQYAEQIREGSRQTAQLVEDLLQFSQVTGRELRRNAIDMEQLVRQVVAELRFDVEGRDVVFDVGELGTAQGDPALVHQILVNLLGNAVKFTRPREQARISIECNETASPAVYTIADNGVGFDGVDSPRLFNVFQRYHQPDDFEGSGVGLAIVKRIVSRHGGRIWAESTVGAGARFHFTLEPESMSPEGPANNGR